MVQEEGSVMDQRTALSFVRVWTTKAKNHREEADQAHANYLHAIKMALDHGAGKQEVARAAGVTPSAMYKSLRKVYGPRKGGTE
jgi:DNA-binding phage protein